ncbi:AbrB/MazE/SpoVT family DNA-binding domain-containing protein [Natrinema salsiterrestre]|uniref:AbrB/MazE/SpoVT family DNA-binding domain-containing protein n=1 Tax=Natrinema salsiterrestre TaxID=2950540 RepID=A0A9Q4L0F4_9EURY|nr:AbrB/MazE/SpoVT family DNA-binding domain-containing protein [Natrinema salsiterrestre]MDF9747670.1 AbrB/MazE/SpoVT family DNA-binding domain-containing protein [Natrinema salsiterrestre]
MSASESSSDSEKEIVAVTKHGQATIPKRFREKLDIDAPGKVLFRETDDGTVVVERVRSASEMQGFAARSDPSTDTPATELLRDKRAQDKSERDAQFSSDK